LPKPYK